MCSIPLSMAGQGFGDTPPPLTQHASVGLATIRTSYELQSPEACQESHHGFTD